VQEELAAQTAAAEALHDKRRLEAAAAAAAAKCADAELRDVNERLAKTEAETSDAAGAAAAEAALLQSQVRSLQHLLSFPWFAQSHANKWSLLIISLSSGCALTGEIR